MQADNSAGRYGYEDVESRTSEFNALAFLVNQLLNARNTATLVKVVSVTNSGDTSPVGFVDVQPLVNQLDGQGVPIAHGVVHGLPYQRLQGGANAVIIDPQKGDIGLAVFADRDISSVKANKAAANPGSMRRADMADGLYLGGFLNGAPTQYVQFTATGINITSPQKITLTAPQIELDAAQSVTITTPQFIVNGKSQFNGDVGSSGTITGNEVVGGGKTLSSHVHKGVKAGTDISGPPQ